MARDCAARLAPWGYTIAVATDFYLAHLENANRSITVDALVKEYEASKRRTGHSDVHLTDFRYRLGAFARDFGRAPVRTLTSAAIEDWLHALALSPTSFNNFRSRLRALFAYGVRRNYLDSDPVAVIDPVKEVDRPPEIFTIDGLSAVLAQAGREILPTLAVGAFAGLRTAELLRLSWSEVDLVRGFVEVTANKSKTARRRLIPIADNLLAWLRPYAGRSGKVYPSRAQKYHTTCRQISSAVGLRWPKNGLRHSYASYHLARHQNAPELSLHLGHTSPHMVFAHYREVVRPDEAKRYWDIRPPGEVSNVISLSPAEVAL
jgi:integrase